jgi:hypothetical protein
MRGEQGDNVTEQGDLQPQLRRQAIARVGGMPGDEREALLVKCWMSHDARWYMAVAREFGLDAASRLNQQAARDEGRVEARRVLKALGVEMPRTRDEALLAQEILATALTRDVSYAVVPTGDDSFKFRMGRCFAFEQVTAAAVADHYDCGIFARVQGWWEAFGLPYELDPLPGRCPRAQGRECVFAFRGIGAARA